jgi:hypothetical protein
MNYILLFVILLINTSIYLVNSQEYVGSTLNKYNHYTKRISPYINTGGRLQNREIVSNIIIIIIYQKILFLYYINLLLL